MMQLKIMLYNGTSTTAVDDLKTNKAIYRGHL